MPAETPSLESAVIANEFAAVRVQVASRGRGVRLIVQDLESGASVSLDPWTCAASAWPARTSRSPGCAAGAWLQVEACGICGSDWSWYAEREIPAPFVPGHEMVGRIVAAWGDHGNPALVPGVRVAIEEALPCWSCPECRSGRHRMCARSTRYGGTALTVAPALWGGFSRYAYLAPRTSAHPVPESLDAGLATLFIPVSNGLSWRRAAGPGTRRGSTRRPS